MMPSPHLRTLCGAALCFAAPCIALGAEALCIEPWQTMPPILLAAAAAPGDLLQSLKGQSGQLPGDVTYSALRANAADGKLELTGQVDVHMGQREIQAEHATYDRAGNSIDVNGSVHYRDPVVLVAGDTGHYGGEGGQFSHAQLDFLQRPGHATADQIMLSPGNIVTLRAVTYTSCPRPRADWQIRAHELTLDVDASRGVGHGAIVDFESVPILYLPWISFPLSSARESGLLFPNFGSSSLSGAFLGEPWYWNIAPNQDATFTPTYYSTRGLDLGAEYRLLTESDRGTVDANIMPHDRQTDSERSYVRLIDRYQMAWNTRIDVNFENVSDDEYFEDFTQGTQSTSTPFLMRSLAAMHRDDIWDLRAELVGYQTIDDTLPVADRPYIQLPRLTAAALWSPPDWTQLQTGFDSELVNFTRAGCPTSALECAAAAGISSAAVNVSGWRLDAKPQIGLDLSGPGYFLRPNAAWEFTQYALRDADGESSSQQRSLPILSIDSGLQFERLSGSDGVRYVTLEPRAMYVYIPYRNQDGLPVFDSATPDPNLIELFRPNRYLGLDRIGDENGLTMGLTTQIFDSASGARYLSATIGQAVYFRQPRVTLPAQALNSLSTSSLIAEIVLSAYKNWNLQVDVASNPSVSGIEQDEVTLQYHPSNQQVANISYRYRSGELEQIDSSVAWPVAQHWDAYARAVYSLFSAPSATPIPIAAQSIEDFAGFQYRGACWNIRALWQRSLSTRTGQYSSGVSFQLELTGLSSVGSQVSTFLEQSIRGYSSSPGRQPLF